MEDYAMTKIVATLGPASNTKEKIRELFKAGVTMFRINSSHETPEVHQKTLNLIREIEKEEKQLIPVLLDLQGPKIRLGTLEAPIEIKKNDILKFRHQDKQTEDIIPVDYAGIAKDEFPTKITDFLSDLVYEINHKIKFILITIGGETSFKCASKIDSVCLEILDAILPAIPLCIDSNGKVIVTKSGNFGAPSTLCEIIDYFDKLKNENL